MSRVTSLFTPYNFVSRPTTTNREGFPAYERPLKEQYLQVLLTNTLGNTFYATSEQLLREAEELHDTMAQEDPEFMAKALVFARNDGFMRLQPTWGLTKLAKVQPKLFEKIFDRVILIPSDLQDFFTIIKAQGRGQGGRAIKRVVGKWLNEKVSEYWAIKYNGRGRGYSLGDIVKTVHPKPKDTKQSTLFAYLVGRDCDISILPQISAFEAFKRVKDSKEKARLITEGRLPHEVVTGVSGLDTDCWRALVPQLPAMALLRNLNTLERHGVLEEAREYITKRLTDKEALQKAKIFPFQFLKAFQRVNVPWVKDVLRQAVEITVANIPSIPGRTAIFLDTSGSMDGDYLLIGGVFAIALYKKTNGNAVFLTFDTVAKRQDISLYDSILSQASKLYAYGGTDTSSPMKYILEKRIKVDNIIMITDEQQNAGKPFYYVLSEYRNKINPHVKTFIVDVSPYRSALVPDESQTYYIYGWSDRVLQFIPMVIEGFGGLVEKVNLIEL